MPAGSSYYGYYSVRLNITVMRTPIEMFYDPTTFDSLYSEPDGVAGPAPVGYKNVNCELPIWTHDDIMAIALEDAGLASRDDALMKMSMNSKAGIGGPKFSTPKSR